MTSAKKENHEVKVRRECKRRQIAIHKQGQTIRLIGPGIDLRAANFDAVTLADLQPILISHKESQL